MQRLNAFTEAMNRQLAEFDNKVSQTMQGIAAEYDAREAKFLSGIDQQLEDYKKEMEGRFKRLSATGGDVDKLEATLRNLVDRSEKEVSGNLEKFTDEITQKESSFEASMRERSQALATELAQLKAGVDELKNKAYMSTSANLKKFEDSFEHDLKQREQELSSHLIEWKNDFDNKITKISDEYEQNRRKLEGKYMDALKKRIAELQEVDDGKQDWSTIGDLQTEASGALAELDTQLRNLNQEDIANIGQEAAQLMAALGSGQLDATQMETYAAELQKILDLVTNADSVLGEGNPVTEGIANAMTAYDWSGDATTITDSLRSICAEKTCVVIYLTAICLTLFMNSFTTRAS